jgi:protein-S-isoprenylcysteine O-methyltransferase Ste14
MSGWRQARAIALLPGNVTIVVPALLLLLVEGPEEPGLERRFGEAYRVYKRAVPRWLPRRDPWRPT